MDPFERKYLAGEAKKILVLSLVLWRTPDKKRTMKLTDGQFLVRAGYSRFFLEAQRTECSLNLTNLPLEWQVLWLARSVDCWCSWAQQGAEVERGNVASWEQVEGSAKGTREDSDGVQDRHCVRDSVHSVVGSHRKRDCFEGHAKRRELWRARENVLSLIIEIDKRDEGQIFALAWHEECEWKWLDERR